MMAGVEGRSRSPVETSVEGYRYALVDLDGLAGGVEDNAAVLAAIGVRACISLRRSALSCSSK